MAYGIQLFGSDGTLGIQIDEKLPRIIAGGSFTMPAGNYGNGYAIVIIIPVEYSTSTLSLMINPSHIDDLAYGWHFSMSRIFDTDSQWKLIINAMTATAVTHISHLVNYNIIEWR